jgi:hypothetical protein
MFEDAMTSDFAQEQNLSNLAENCDAILGCSEIALQSQILCHKLTTPPALSQDI